MIVCVELSDHENIPFGVRRLFCSLSVHFIMGFYVGENPQEQDNFLLILQVFFCCCLFLYEVHLHGGSVTLLWSSEDNHWYRLSLLPCLSCFTIILNGSGYLVCEILRSFWTVHPHLITEILDLGL